MRNVGLLRTLVVLNILMTIAYLVIESLLQGLLPEALRAYLAAKGDVPVQTWQVIVVGLWWILVVVTLLAWIGLLSFWKHAPLLYLTACVGALALDLGTGPSVQTAVGSGMNRAISILDGLILALVYFTDLRSHFGQRPKAA